MQSLKEFSKEKKLFVAAHRGSSGLAPENTLSAIEWAVKVGAEMIEIDIQLTSDGKLAVYHDLNKILKGKEIKENYSFDELKEFDAGAWFDDKFIGERIPLLSDALDLIKGKAYLNLEIKTHSANNFRERTNKIIEEAAKFDMLDQVLFASFDYKTLHRIKKSHPELPTAIIKIPGDGRPPSEIVHHAGADAYICSLKQLNYMESNDLKDHGIFTGVYDINTSEELKEALEYHITTVATDYPEMIIGELKKMGKL